MGEIKCANCDYEYETTSVISFCPRCASFGQPGIPNFSLKNLTQEQIQEAMRKSGDADVVCEPESDDTKTGEDSGQGATSGVNSWQVVLSQRAAVPYLYASLYSVLSDALHQAAAGKGKERHANDDPFERQSICEITRKHGLAFATGQAAKKLEESHRLLQLRGAEAAINEILGAINYAAAAVIVLREGEGE